MVKVTDNSPLQINSALVGIENQITEINYKVDTLLKRLDLSDKKVEKLISDNNLLIKP